jgi:biopolymer transport protein ExbB
VFEIFLAGGILMWPILVCSILALAIFVERFFFALRRARVVPPHLLPQIWQLHKAGKLEAGHLQALRGNSPLGRALAAGLKNLGHSREIMKEAIEEEGRQVVHELERYLELLGTIVTIAPLLGLLGTVFGMIQVFDAITRAGVGDTGVIAGGISVALITTAAGLTVAIPALVFHRVLIRRVDELVVAMEEQAVKMVEVIHGEREK